MTPTLVFDTYWHFAAERQNVFMRRMTGESSPWTDDPILRTYKFTCPYRAADRVSQYLIRNVIYDGVERDARDIIFRILLFKTFNKIETWEFLKERLGDLSARDFNTTIYGIALDLRREAGESIYSAAYVMPQPDYGLSGGKHWNHLALIRDIVDNYADAIARARSMSQVFRILRERAGIGDFLAYQYAVDLNYSEVCSFSESTFVVPGPGARDGIRKCFSALGGLDETGVIARVCEVQEVEFARLGLNFQRLGGSRPLQWIDCQNLFCEVDKYSRVAHPEVVGISGRSKIKQKFAAHLQPLLNYAYPPKWGIGKEVARASAG